jgi:TolA-binding protein
VRGILQVFHGRNRLPAALALLLTLPVGGLTAAPAAPDATAKTDAIEVEDRKLLADGLFSRGFHELALPEYLALSTRQPPPAALDEVLFRLGECQRQLKRLPDAEASFRRLTLELPQSPLHDRAVLMRGLIVVEMGNPSVGAALLESLLKSATNADLRASATYHAGEAHEKAGDAARAEAHFRTLREKAPAHELAAYAGLRLAALQARGDDPKALDAAMALYQQLADKPFNARVGAEALFQAASLAYARGQFETSARLFRQLAERYPEDQRTAEAARPSAWAHFRIDRFADALKSATAGAALEGQPADALAEWLYLRANCERRLDRHAEALKSYEALLALEPAPAYAPAARYERLLVLFKEGAYEQVLKEADAIVNPPTDYVADLYWIQAAAAEALKDSARAIQFYGLLIRDAPDSPLTIDAVYRLAYQLQQQKSWAEASRAYLVLAERWPTNDLAPQALFASGFCLSQAGQSDGALRDWHQLLTRYPKHETIPEALFQKAMEETGLGKSREAATTLDTLMREHPKYPRLDEARFWRAQHAYGAREMKEAERLLRECLAGHPPLEVRREASFLLGLVLQATERDAEAAAMFQPLIDAPIGEKFSVDRLSWLAEFQFSRKAFAESEAAARAMLERAPTPEWQQTAYTLLARSRQAREHPADAIEAYTKALDTGARTRYGAEAALRLGELLMATGRLEQAEARLQEAARRASTPELQEFRAYAYAALGAVAEKRGDREAAVRYLMSVAILFDDAGRVPEALDRAATLLAELGREEESRAAVAELLERYPESAQARRRRQADAAAAPPAGKEER